MLNKIHRNLNRAQAVVQPSRVAKVCFRFHLVLSDLNTTVEFAGWQGWNNVSWYGFRTSNSSSVESPVMYYRFKSGLSVAFMQEQSSPPTIVRLFEGGARASTCSSASCSFLIVKKQEFTTQQKGAVVEGDLAADWTRYICSAIRSV